MADVKWIKLMTDVFDNRKIRQIEAMPDGDTIIVIWFKLLTLAAETNDSGLVYFTADLPYTDQLLATQFNRNLQTVQLALTTFERFGMIEVVDEVIKVSNWERYQNVEGLERMREQNRLRVAKHREKKRMEAITQKDLEQAADVSEAVQNAVEAEIKPAKHRHGEFNHVMLTDAEMGKLEADLGKDMTADCIAYLDEYIERKGYKAKSHYLTIKKWVIDAVKREKGNNSGRLDWIDNV